MASKNKITRERYEERVRRALSYIHENLKAPLSLEDVAAASYFSPFHFHRIFHSLVGETLNEYIRRKRLEQAVAWLVYDDSRTITEVALSCGFSSSSNFSKAFSNYFGCSPSEVRDPSKFKDNSKIGELKRKHGKDFDPRKFYPEFIHQIQEIDMDVQVIDQKEKRVAFLTSPRGYEQKEVMETWDKVCKWAEDNKLVNADYYGACYDNPLVTPADKCRYDAAITVNADTVIAAPFEEEVIPAGKYAMAYYRGPEDPDATLHMKIYREWLPQSGFEPDDFPLLERYLNDHREDGYVEMQVLIKLKD
jgi:AraC family transcriptional regulator